MKSGLEKIKRSVGAPVTDENGWRVVTDAFGDRQAIAGNWTLRAAAAIGGIYGNDAAEALYPLLATDSDGERARWQHEPLHADLPGRATAARQCVLVGDDV